MMMKKQNVRTLALIIVTFTYLLIGAAIFDALESREEEFVRKNLDDDELYYKSTYNISDEEFDSFTDIVVKYHPYRTFPQWKFAGSFYFSLTVITTIGYGHSTPQTNPGKAFCMFYAIIGIPLCLVMFQSVGERVNYFNSLCIEFVKKCIKIKKPEVSQTEMVLAALLITLTAIAGGAAMFNHYEDWDYFDSIYYCVITLTTIGFGDYVALQDKKRKNDLSNTSYAIFSFIFILFGLAVVASSLNLLVLRFLTMNTEDERREEYTRKVHERMSLQLSQSNLVSIGVTNNNHKNSNAGPTLCTFNPENLDDLKKETSSTSFYQTVRNSVRTFMRKQFPFIRSDNTIADNVKNKKHLNGCAESGHLEKLPKCSLTSATSYQTISNNTCMQSPSKKICPECLTQMKHSSKKNHYTVRRAPGKISHLIPSSQSNDLIINFDKHSNRTML